VPGLGRVKLGAGCTRFRAALLQAAESNPNCLILLLNPTFTERSGASLFDIFTALVTVCTLRQRGQATARKPYIEALMLLARSRNIGEIVGENRLTEGSSVIVAYCCTDSMEADIPELEPAEECKLPPLEPRVTGEMLVFAIDAKLLRKQLKPI
jgi:hypothetical protein